MTDTVGPPRPYKIALGWVIGGIFGTFIVLEWLKPLAGWGTRILLIGVLVVTVCPIGHVLAARFLFPRGWYFSWLVIGFFLFALATLYFVLGTTGIFAFT